MCGVWAGAQRTFPSSRDLLDYIQTSHPAQPQETTRPATREAEGGRGPWSVLTFRFLELDRGCDDEPTEWNSTGGNPQGQIEPEARPNPGQRPPGAGGGATNPNSSLHSHAQHTLTRNPSHDA